MTRRVEITVSEETWQRLEALRGHEPRASFVKRALEKATGGVGRKVIRPSSHENLIPPRLGKGFVPPRPKGK